MRGAASPAPPLTEQATSGSSRTGWTGRWVADALGVRIITSASPIGVKLHELVGLAVRRNPKRAHLLVSTVLGKHVPTDPDLVYASGRLLGELAADLLTGTPGDSPANPHAHTGALVRAALAGDRSASGDLLGHVHQRQRQRLDGASAVLAGTVVVGYAETATALGHAVADAIEVPYLHSTRRPVEGVRPVGGFEEEHSHATSHLLLPEDPALLVGRGPLVLVDDELSTGTTALNTIAALHDTHPRSRYVIAALVDLRSTQDRERMTRFAAGLGVHVDVVALAAGFVELPMDVLARGQELVADTEAGLSSDGQHVPVTASHAFRLTVDWPDGAKEGGRHGFTPADRHVLDGAVATLAQQARPLVAAGERVHVLGFEELMYAPLRFAQALAASTSAAVTYSTTTRSPVLPVDDAGYAIRTRLAFPAHDNPDDGPGPRFAYNLTSAADSVQPRFGLLLLVVDADADTDDLHRPGGLLAQLAASARQVALVVLPNYRPAARVRPTSPNVKAP